MSLDSGITGVVGAEVKILVFKVLGELLGAVPLDLKLVV